VLSTFKSDLHCHSIFSDGSNTPEELVEIAKKIGLQGIALTDHDTFDGLERLEKTGFPVISGAEFSSNFKDNSIHILAYSFNPKASSLRELVQEQEEKRHLRMHQILSRLNELGFPMSLEEVLELRGDRGDHAIGRPHLANLMLKKGFVKSREEAFHTWLGEKGKAFVSSTYPESEEVIERIHAAGGLAILAHPHLLPKGSLRKSLLNLPFDGLEGRYARMRPNQNEPWIREGKKRGWIVTGGSDYHGAPRTDITLGNAYTDESTFKMLQAKYNTHKAAT